jgi:integrase
MRVFHTDTAAVLRVLKPIWEKHTVTADRVRGGIELVLSWATTSGFREGENPARWKGHLENLLAKKTRVARVTHLAALPYKDLPAFMARLRGDDSITTTALEFVILTCARSGEALGAVWPEIDTEACFWTVPAERMKGGRKHEVPLSGAAMAVLERMAAIGQNDFVFAGGSGAGQLPESSMRDLLTRLSLDGETTVHGFRSGFADWTTEPSRGARSTPTPLRTGHRSVASSKLLDVGRL